MSNLNMTMWSGPLCPSCGHKTWTQLIPKNGPSSMICNGCKKVYGPEIKHAHKRFTPDGFYSTISKG